MLDINTLRFVIFYNTIIKYITFPPFYALFALCAVLVVNL